MQVFKNLVIALGSMVYLSPISAQYSDSFHVSDKPATDSLPPIIHSVLPDYKKAFPYKSFLVPAVMVTYGFLSLENQQLKQLNQELKDEIWTEQPHKKTILDNYLQFAPAAAVYGLNAVGIHGKHNFRDLTAIYLMSNVFLNVAVVSLKSITHKLRPDGSDYASFPSGHTTEAFASAEFMRMEYKDVSPWYGVAGYAMAFATGYLRMYNNKHYFGDLIAGAGFGIASTQLAYWLYPKIQHSIYKDKPVHTMIMPYYQNGSGGLSLVHDFSQKIISR